MFLKNLTASLVLTAVTASAWTAADAQSLRPSGPANTVPSAEATTGREPAVVFATTSIKCGDTIYEVSTGTDTGSCSTGGGGVGKQKTSATCSDVQSGSKATATCTSGCGGTSGSGSCTIKAAR